MVDTGFCIFDEVVHHRCKNSALYFFEIFQAGIHFTSNMNVDRMIFIFFSDVAALNDENH